MRPNPKGGFHYICDLLAGSHKQVDEKNHPSRVFQFGGRTCFTPLADRVLI